MPVQLFSLTDGPSFALDKPILLVGRDLECDIRLDSRKISRRHCCVAQVGDHVVVRDLGSTNGIRINGIRVLEGYLKAGDELTIGNQMFQVRWEGLAPRTKKKNKEEAPPAANGIKKRETGLDHYSSVAPISDPLMERGEIHSAPSQGQSDLMDEDEDEDEDDAAPMGRPLHDLIPGEIGLAPGSDFFVPPQSKK